MTVVLCGVGGDTGNVRPVPQVDADGRFEYLPIPEKGPTTETGTYGSLTQRYGDGPLADLLTGVRPGSNGGWLTDPDTVAAHPVHYDPNLDALSYGEHRPAYVSRLRGLDPGDIVAFYTGLRGPDSDEKHRYLFGYFTVGAKPTVLDPELDLDAKRRALETHPRNAHTKRFQAAGDLYYHDDSFTDRPETVVVVDGRDPGGLLDRAIRLSDRRQGPNYYMTPELVDRLAPESAGEGGVHLGGIKPAIRAEVSREQFLEMLDRRP